MAIADDNRGLDDVALIRLLTAGDDDAFSVLYRRHVPAVLAFLRARVPEPELAFDLTAETFAVLALDAAKFRDDGPLIAWLLGIARNKLIQSYRHRQVEDRARQALGLTAITLHDEDLARVEERADVGRADLEAALVSLAPEMRAALLARVVDEREYADIGAELGCSSQLVRQRVHRGLTRLRSALEGD
jgi:RNA polymerase sigma factor (sigma-70 family)